MAEVEAEGDGGGGGEGAVRQVGPDAQPGAEQEGHVAAAAAAVAEERGVPGAVEEGDLAEDLEHARGGSDLAELLRVRSRSHYATAGAAPI